MVEYRLQVPGNYILVDHSIFRAFNKGALGVMTVTGEDNKTVYSGKVMEEIYQPEGGAAQSIQVAGDPVVASNKAERVEFGQRVYNQICTACHQTSGLGVPGAFPPLAESDYLNADKGRAIDIVINGLSGPVTVNGKEYNGQMPAWQLADEDIANVLTFVYDSWGNAGYEVTPEDVARQRKTD